MTDQQLQSEPLGDGSYSMSTESYDGTVTVTVSLVKAAELTDGRLTDDEATARATLRYLLGHQDAADLPEFIDIGDVLAAYDDAEVEISRLV